MPGRSLRTDDNRLAAAGDLLAAGGEMGERIRALDWARTPLGPIAGWPASFKTAVRLLLGSRYPMFLWWGPKLINLYNDPYVPILGARHPEALGRPAPQIWGEIWKVVGAQADTVLTEGRATWNDSLLLVMERYGYTEETYFTFSYSPAPDDRGGVGGVFCVCTEDTARVLGERRLRILRELGERSLVEGESAEQICRSAAAVLAGDPHDFPFALLYLLDDRGDTARLRASTGLEAGARAAPVRIGVGGEDDVWGLGAAIAGGRPRPVEDLAERFGRLPAGPWTDDSTRSGLVLPLTRAGEPGRPAGFLVAGLSPRLRFDADYRSLLELTADQLATGLAHARAYEEERRRAEALAELDRAKTAFFSNVSHELRTPLTLILGPIDDLLRESGASPADRERLEVAHRSALRLLKLVNTLLDFSRIEAGRISASYRPVDLSSLTGELASLFRSAAERAGLELAVDCPPLPEPVWVDREMWEKIVLNLLSNAFKFTFEGRIAVSVRPAGEAVELTVADTGTGIPAEELPRLFDRFHRIEAARARSQEGSGIGLALVQELVRLHGGTVRVDSEPGRGTAFTVALPLGSGHLPADRLVAEPAPAAAGPQGEVFVEEVVRWLPEDGTAGPEGSGEIAPPPAADSGAGEARVLVADDNADMRAYLRRLLGQRYEVLTAADGAEALERARAERFQLVLADVMMPRLDGFGLLAELRADETTATIPVILLSARAGEESRVEGMAAGADDYVVKPFSARELMARVEGHLELHRVRRETTERLREADRRKDEFLALLAHELRNPLAPIRSAAQVLKLAGTDTAPGREAREVIERQVQHLTRLVDDLLDVSRITRGIVQLELETVDLESVVRRAVEISRPLIDGRGHELTLTLPESPVRVRGDRVRLVQVVGNLLHNAAKYTENGGRIEVAVAEEDGEAVIRVRDNGIGLAPEVLPRVFDLFAQAEGTLDRAQGGLGVGLTLVRELVERHGGTAEARSDGPGRGSEFLVRLPVSTTESEAAPDDGAAGATEPERRPLRVLIVEDNPDSAEMLRLLLELDGHDAHAVGDGAAALEAAGRLRPAVVLCDLGLPGMSGYEVAQRFRRRDDLGSPVLVALTGYGHDAARRHAREAGFDHHLLKPLEPAALRALLASIEPR